MTTDRRKTFNTAEEFLLWTLASATNKRKARDTEGNLWSAYLIATRLHYITYGERVGQLAASKASMESHLFPLTAVEDEHGAIEEPDPRGEAERAYALRMGGNETKLVVALIDERIAAATMEHKVRVRDDITGGWKDTWIEADYCLKPKAES